MLDMVLMLQTKKSDSENRVRMYAGISEALCQRSHSDLV